MLNTFEILKIGISWPIKRVIGEILKKKALQ